MKSVTVWGLDTSGCFVHFFMYTHKHTPNSGPSQLHGLGFSGVIGLCSAHETVETRILR